MSQPQNLSPLSYRGVRSPNPPNVIVKNFDPLPTTANNVAIGDFWINFDPKSPLTAKLFVLLSLQAGVANWVEIVASAGDILSLTGNSGGAVSATGGNINILGDGVTATVAGNPGTSTLTITSTGNFPSGTVDIINSTASATSPADANLIKNRAGGPIVAGDQIGCVNFQGYDSTSTPITAGSICVINPASSTIGPNRVAGQMQFSTHPNNGLSANPTLRMILDQTGVLDINASDGDTANNLVNITTPTFAVFGSSVLATNNLNTTGGATAQLLKSRGVNPVQTNDTLGVLNFTGFDSTSTATVGARIASVATGVIGAAQVPSNLLFSTADSIGTVVQRMQITSEGNVKISQADNDTLSGVTPASFAVTGSSLISQSNNNTLATNGAQTALLRSRSLGPITSGDRLGTILFEGYDSTSTIITAAGIISDNSGTIGASRVAGDLQFYTHPDSATPSTQRMIINPAGIVIINTPDTSNAGLQVKSSVSVQADPGSGTASSTDFTNTTSTAVGAGTFTIKSNSANPANSTGFIKIYVNGSAKWIPFFDNPSP